MRMVVVLTLALPGCGGDWFFQGNDKDDGEDTGAVDDVDTTDADADGDADADADTDVDTDTDTDPGECRIECDADTTYPTPDPGSGGASCVTEALACGDVVEGTLDGGSSIYDYDFWLLVGELDVLIDDPEALDGPERVYTVRVEPDQIVVATFETCFDPWATWVLFGDAGGAFCDVDTYYTAGVFEYHDAPTGCPYGWSTERRNVGNSPYDVELILEGLYGATGNYRLTIDCY